MTASNIANNGTMAEALERTSASSTPRNSVLEIPKIDEKGAVSPSRTSADNTIALDTEKDGLSKIDASDYPTGFRLMMIVVALILSIFLVSLDMVSSPLRFRSLISSIQIYRCSQITNRSFLLRQSWVPRFRKLQISFIHSILLVGTAQPSSWQLRPSSQHGAKPTNTSPSRFRFYAPSSSLNSAVLFAVSHKTASRWLLVVQSQVSVVLELHLVRTRLSHSLHHRQKEQHIPVSSGLAMVLLQSSAHC